MIQVPHSRRRFLQTALGTAALLGAPGLLAACGDDGDTDADAPAGSTGSTSSPSTATGASSTAAATTVPTELVDISILEPFPLFLIFFAEVAALSGGYTERNGIDVDLQFARSAPQALQQLAAGSVVACNNGPLGVVRAVAQEGAPFKMVAMTIQDTLYRLVSTPKRPLTGARELPGRTVGFPTLGGNAEDTFNILLRDAGVDPDDVQRVAVGNDAAALALVDEGRIDCIFATLEAAAAIRASGMEANVVTFENANPLLGSGLVTTLDNLEPHRAGLVGWIRSLREVMTAIRDGDVIEELIPTVRAEWDLPQLDEPEKVIPIVQAYPEMWFSAGEENLLRHVPERWEAGMEGFVKVGLADPGTDPTTFYTNDLWDEAVRG